MITLLHGDCRDQLATLPDRSVQCIVTSPPYYGLRKYTDDPKEIGQEPTPAAYVAALVAVFAACWRVLRDDGTLWVNLGDSYNSQSQSNNGRSSTLLNEDRKMYRETTEGQTWPGHRPVVEGLQQKNLLGMPWRVAFALQDAGWILRSDIIWSKPNPMPESVRDRPTRAHEYMFLFAKRQRYYYDATAIAEAAEARPITTWEERKQNGEPMRRGDPGASGHITHTATLSSNPGTRNKRTVWTIATQPYAGAHFATMPEALIEPCILAGSAAQACETCGAAWVRVVEREAMIVREGPGRAGLKESTNGSASRTAITGTMIAPPKVHDRGFAPACRCETNTGSARSIVLDPFGGAGTVAKVAERFQRDSIMIDLNAEYVELQEQRTNGVQVDMLL